MSDARPWLVTGGAGFLGSHVVEQSLARGTSVVVVDDLSTGRRAHLPPRGTPGFTLIEEDVRDPLALEMVFRRHRPAAVIHLADVSFIPACEADPARTNKLNVGGTSAVLAAAHETGVTHFWFASTGEVYGPSMSAHRETETPAPFGVYGTSKREAEKLVEAASRRDAHVHFVVGRLFNLYGPRETNPHFVPEVLAQLRAGSAAPLRLGNLWPRRDLVPVADAARAVLASLDVAPPGLTTINVGTGVARSMRDVLNLIGELRGRPVPVELDPQKVRTVERPHLQADVTRLRALIGWTPHVEFRSALVEILASNPPR